MLPLTPQISDTSRTLVCGSPAGVRQRSPAYRGVNELIYTGTVPNLPLILSKNTDLEMQVDVTSCKKKYRV